MTVYYVDDGGSNTSPYDTWAKAAPTLAGLQTAIAGSTGTGGNVIYIGADSVSSGDGAAVTFTGPTSGICTIISATVGTTTYAASTTNQISTSGTLQFTGNFALFGVQANGGDSITLSCPTAASGALAQFYTYGSTFKLASNRTMNLSGGGSTNQGKHNHYGITVSAANDAGASTQAFITLVFCTSYIDGATFVDSGTHRTGPVILANGSSSDHKIAGADFSALTAVSGLIGSGSNCRVELSNCKTVASPTITSGVPYAAGVTSAINCANSNSPTMLYHQNFLGAVSSDTTNYRNSGATVETVNVAWKMVSTANASTANPLLSPWIYGAINSTGSKTFTLHVTQDGGAGDLTDADTWLEVQYLGTSSVGKFTIGTDRCAIDGNFSGAAVQTDDTSSTWAGTITETYMQQLNVTGTVNAAGLYRARVALGKASTTLYVDPLVTVS